MHLKRCSNSKILMTVCSQWEWFAFHAGLLKTVEFFFLSVDGDSKLYLSTVQPPLLAFMQLGVTCVASSAPISAAQRRSATTSTASQKAARWLRLALCRQRGLVSRSLTPLPPTHQAKPANDDVSKIFHQAMSPSVDMRSSYKKWLGPK